MRIELPRADREYILFDQHAAAGRSGRVGLVLGDSGRLSCVTFVMHDREPDTMESERVIAVVSLSGGIGRASSELRSAMSYAGEDPSDASDVLHEMIDLDNEMGD